MTQNEAQTRGAREQNEAQHHLQPWPAEILLAAATGLIDLNDLAKCELASHGLGKDGRWVGFDRAHEVWGVEGRWTPPRSDAHNDD